jgi:hypothetical protein
MGKGRTYNVIRSHRGKDRIREEVVEAGLDWDAADAKRNQLNEAERRAHPDQTSWMRDLFLVQREKG